MNEFWVRINKAVNKLMPYALILLLILIILELSIKTHNEYVVLLFEFLDMLIVEIFVIDLIFLYIKSKNIRFFFTNYWLDILAVFPFGLVFRFAESFFRIGLEAERLVIGQGVIHEIAKSEKLLKFVTEASKEIRLLRFIPKSIEYIKNTNIYAKLHDYFFYNKSQYEHTGKYSYHSNKK
jgi:voltage-gated potassium channel